MSEKNIEVEMNKAEPVKPQSRIKVIKGRGGSTRRVQGRKPKWNDKSKKMFGEKLKI